MTFYAFKSDGTGRNFGGRLLQSACIFDCARSSSLLRGLPLVALSRSYSLIAVYVLLIAVASLVWNMGHRLQ